ncbi:ATP-binding protein [Kitasatospora sp. CM 4170]|uniref:ATP-binding protein n=1 Tax=Kitasatospora aburaviensis TaxID=67265 RepID=A0ABW1F1R4_9ACTN|nr:ATP-binding protein [Kitasatospora sp. CM 4170]WNM43541.1 ATP-binding protein [Kitasatospora sp. CM 4170]
MTVEIFSVPAKESEVSAVRRRIPIALVRLGINLSPDEIDTVVLLVSEVATNAVVHGSHRDDPTATLTVEVRLVPPLRRVRVLVLDAGRGRPRARVAGTDAEDGRGLFLVARLAADHGVELGADGRTIVWFEAPVADWPGATGPARRRTASDAPPRSGGGPRMERGGIPHGSDTPVGLRPA